MEVLLCFIMINGSFTSLYHILYYRKSSARKLRRSGVNLLGGRALWNRLFPLVSAEIQDFDLDRALNNGMLPRHYLAVNAKKRLQGYVGVLLGYYVPAYSKTVKRKLIQAPRFYLFDVGVTNYLLKRGHLENGSPEYGHVLEQFVILEMTAYLHYTDSEEALSYWRTSSNIEVDAILGDAKVAVEIKSTKEARPKDMKGLKAFSEEHPQARLILVSQDANPRVHDGIEIMPVKYFLSQLWSGKIV